jgi:hypothetical protein
LIGLVRWQRTRIDLTSTDRGWRSRLAPIDR